MNSESLVARLEDYAANNNIVRYYADGSKYQGPGVIIFEVIDTIKQLQADNETKSACIARAVTLITQEQKRMESVFAVAGDDKIYAVLQQILVSLYPPLYPPLKETP